MKTGIKQVLTAGVLAGAVLLGGCGGKINPASTVVNINDGKDKITIGYANFTARYAQASMESMFGNYIQKGYWQENTSDDSGETM